MVSMSQIAKRSAPAGAPRAAVCERVCMGQHALRSDFGVASLLAVTERLLLLGPVTLNVVLDAHSLTVLCTRVLVWPQGIASHIV